MLTRSAKYFITVLSLLFCRSVFGQDHKIDSLLTVLKTTKEDTNKVKLLVKLGNKYRDIGGYDSSIIYGKQATALSEKLKFKRGIANSFNLLGTIDQLYGNYEDALKNYFAALKIREEMGNKIDIAASYNNIG